MVLVVQGRGILQLGTGWGPGSPVLLGSERSAALARTGLAVGGSCSPKLGTPNSCPLLPPHPHPAAQTTAACGESGWSLGAEPRSEG